MTFNVWHLAEASLTVRTWLGKETDAYNAKLAVFQAFCVSFDQAAKQFTSGIEHSFTEQFANSFLEFWRQSLSILPLAPPVPTYSSVVAGRTAHRPPGGNATTSAAAPPPEQQQTTVPRFQGRPIPAPPREDLRVFVRLDPEAPARNHGNYAIRTHIAAKVGIDLHQIPAAFPVNSGWAIRTADAAARDLIVERQSEWAEDLGAKSVEVSKKWYTYVVSNCPRRLADLHGNEADYDAAVKDEIACQTKLTPVSMRCEVAPVGRRLFQLLPHRELCRHAGLLQLQLYERNRFPPPYSLFCSILRARPSPAPAKVGRVFQKRSVWRRKVVPLTAVVLDPQFRAEGSTVPLEDPRYHVLPARGCAGLRVNAGSQPRQRQRGHSTRHQVQHLATATRTPSCESRRWLHWVQSWSRWEGVNPHLGRQPSIIEACCGVWGSQNCLI